MANARIDMFTLFSPVTTNSLTSRNATTLTTTSGLITLLLQISNLTAVESVALTTIRSWIANFELKITAVSWNFTLKLKGQHTVTSLIYLWIITVLLLYSYFVWMYWWSNCNIDCIVLYIDYNDIHGLTWLDMTIFPLRWWKIKTEF